MSWFEIVAERKVRDAQEEGIFDDLPGKGKPIDLTLDRRIPPELRAAYRIMAEANVAPPWIELSKEVRARQARWDQLLERFRRRRAVDLERVEAQRRQASRREEARAADAARNRILQSAFDALKELNQVIDRLNLIVPTPAQQLLRVPVRERMAALEAEFSLLAPEPGDPCPAWKTALEQERQKAIRLGNRMPSGRGRRKGID
jgi:hypothetical protein